MMLYNAYIAPRRFLSKVELRRRTIFIFTKMGKLEIFIISLCFLFYLSASTCFGTEEHQPNHNIKYRLNKRDTPPSQVQQPNSSSTSNLSDISLQQQQQQEQQKLLGVNGTGQRKDVSTTTSTPILAATITTRPLNQFNIVNNTYVSDDGFSLDIDEPTNDTEKEILKHNITNISDDYHIYYNSSVIRDKDLCEKHYKDLGKLTVSTMLSHSYRRAMTIRLSFDFPFYGHPIRNVTVATGGFLYTGEHVHSWLAATQYIAPLMANFDTSQWNESNIKYSDNGTAFTVLWEKVKLQDKANVSSFTFSATLFNNGDIIFAYYSIPVTVESIQSDRHPVKVGLSDAYIIDKTIFFARRKTIYEYHRVNFGNEHIENNTLIYLQAQTTCLNYTDCQSCLEAYSGLNCLWCPTINRCSTGTDRRRQEWLHKGCDASKISQAGICPKIGEKGNDYKSFTDEPDVTLPSSTESSIEKSNSVTQSSRINNRKMNLDEHEDAPSSPEHINAEHHKHHSVGTTLGFIIPIGLVLTGVLWAFYAYRNPHTKSGQFLIQYRPSQWGWGWRRGEAHYTAAVQQ